MDGVIAGAPIGYCFDEHPSVVVRTVLQKDVFELQTASSLQSELVLARGVYTPDASSQRVVLNPDRWHVGVAVDIVPCPSEHAWGLSNCAVLVVFLGRRVVQAAHESEYGSAV